MPFVIILIVCVAVVILGIWFPIVKKIYTSILWAIAEVLYFVLFWWWFASIQKARGKSYPDPLIWNQIKRSRNRK